MEMLSQKEIISIIYLSLEGYSIFYISNDLGIPAEIVEEVLTNTTEITILK